MIKKILLITLFTLNSFAITYELIVPKNLKANPKLVVMIHGCTQNAEIFINQTHIKKYAEKRGFIVLAPQKNNIFSNPLRCWSWYSSINNVRNASYGETANILRKIKEVQKLYNVSKTYVAGFSAGAVMSSIMASCHPDIFSGALIHAGVSYKGLWTKNISLPRTSVIRNTLIPTTPDFLFKAKKLKDYMLELSQEDRETSLELQKKRESCLLGQTVQRRLKDVVIFQGAEDSVVKSEHFDKLFVQYLDFERPMSKVLSYEYYRGENHHFLYYGYHASGLRVNAYKLFNVTHQWAGGDENYRFSNAKTINATEIMVRIFNL